MDFKDMREEKPLAEEVVPHSNGAPPPHPHYAPYPAYAPPRRNTGLIVGLSVLAGTLFLALISISMLFAISQFRNTHTSDSWDYWAWSPDWHASAQSWSDGLSAGFWTEDFAENINVWVEDFIRNHHNNSNQPSWPDELSNSIAFWTEDFAANMAQWMENFIIFGSDTSVLVDSFNNPFDFHQFQTWAGNHRVINLNLDDADVDIWPQSDARDGHLRFTNDHPGSFTAYSYETGELIITQNVGHRLVNGWDWLVVYLPHIWDFDYINITTTGRIYIDPDLRVDITVSDNGHTKTIRPMQ